MEHLSDTQEVNGSSPFIPTLRDACNGNTVGSYPDAGSSTLPPATNGLLAELA